MAEYRVRFVAEDGNDTTGDGSAGNPFRLPSKAITDLGTSGALHVNPGVVMIGEGDYTETAVIELTRSIIMMGAGTYLSGVGGTRIIRGHSGHLVDWDAGFDSFSNQYVIKSLSLDGNKASQSAEADLLRIKRPGFNCVIDNVAFRNSTGYALHISEGANSFGGRDLSFAGCGDSSAGGAIEMTNTVAGGGFGIWASFRDLQIDSSGASPILITQEKANRSHIVFSGLLEYETSTTGLHTSCINANLSSGVTNVIISVDQLISQSPAAADFAFKETGAEPATWTINGYVLDSEDGLLSGVNETISSPAGGRTVMGWPGAGVGSSSRTQVGENSWISRQSGTPEGNEIGNIGDLCSRRDGGAGTSLYVKESGNGTNTGWAAV